MKNIINKVRNYEIKWNLGTFVILFLLGMNIGLTAFLTEEYMNRGMSDYELTKDLENDEQRFVNTFKYHEEINIRSATFRKKNLAGLYNSATKTITMREGMQKESFEGVFVHEYAHHLTYKFNDELKSIDAKKGTGVDVEDFADILSYYMCIQKGIPNRLYYVNADDVPAKVEANSKLRADVNFLLEKEFELSKVKRLNK